MSGRSPIRVLANASLLTRVLAERGALTLAELAETTGIPRPSVYRLVDGLASVGLTRMTDDGRVQLGVRWLHLAESAGSALVEWAGAGRILEELSDTTEQTAFFCVRRDDEALCVEWTPARGIGSLILRPGRSLPLYAGGAGRALLAADENADAYLDAAPFPALTEHTLTTSDVLRVDIARTRSRGYARSTDDVTIGIGAIAVAVADPAGHAVGAISLAGRTEDIVANERAYANLLTQSASRLRRP